MLLLTYLLPYLLVCLCVRVVEFSAAENHLTPYTDDSLSPPTDITKCDDAIDVVAVDRRMVRPEIT